MLRKTINDDKVFDKHVHAVDIQGKAYLSCKFIVVFDTCRVNCGTASYAGLDVRSGANINLRYKLPDDDDLKPDYCHTVLESEQTLRIMGTYLYLDE